MPLVVHDQAASRRHDHFTYPVGLRDVAVVLTVEHLQCPQTSTKGYQE